MSHERSPVKRSKKRKMSSQTKSNYSVTMLITLNLIRILKRKKDEKTTTVTKRLSALWSPSLYPPVSLPGEDSLYNDLYGEAPPKRGTFFRPQMYERVGILRDEVYERVGKCAFSVCKKT